MRNDADIDDSVSQIDTDNGETEGFSLQDWDQWICPELTEG